MTYSFSFFGSFCFTCFLQYFPITCEYSLQYLAVSYVSILLHYDPAIIQLLLTYVIHARRAIINMKLHFMKLQ